MYELMWWALGLVVIPLVVGLVIRVVWTRSERDAYIDADPLEPFSKPGKSGPRIPPVA